MTTSKIPVHGTPESEAIIDESLLRRLLADQMPELAEQPIALLGEGWDNVSYRVGRERVVRMPRRQIAAALLENEQRWLPELSKTLPIAVPAPIAVGLPGQGYPWKWSLLPFIPGQSADLHPPATDQAERFAEFLNALHRRAPPDAPVNAYRGVPLADRADAVIERIVRLRAATSQITPAVERAWREGLAAPLAPETTWIHGDLHSRNVLVDKGRFTGIIDWSDLTTGDGATDLAATWMLFDDARARKRVLDLYGANETMRHCARGWAVFFGVLLLDTGLVDHPPHAAIGAKTLRRVTEDD